MLVSSMTRPIVSNFARFLLLRMRAYARATMIRITAIGPIADAYEIVPARVSMFLKSKKIAKACPRIAMIGQIIVVMTLPLRPSLRKYTTIASAQRA